MPYTVKDSNGAIIAVATRLEDAQALSQTVGKELPKMVDNKFK